MTVTANYTNSKTGLDITNACINLDNFKMFMAEDDNSNKYVKLVLCVSIYASQTDFNNGMRPVEEVCLVADKTTTWASITANATTLDDDADLMTNLEGMISGLL